MIDDQFAEVDRGQQYPVEWSVRLWMQNAQERVRQAPEAAEQQAGEEGPGIRDALLRWLNEYGLLEIGALEGVAYALARRRVNRPAPVGFTSEQHIGEHPPEA